MNTNSFRDVYDLITAEIITLLEQDITPWRYPWGASGIPRNPVLNVPYRGINIWLLAALDYETNLFLSWNEIKSINGSVKQGEHGHVVAVEKMQPLRYKTPGGIINPDLRYSVVFNIAQCTGIDDTLFPDPPTLIDPDHIYPGMPNPPRIVPGTKGAYDHARDTVIEPRHLNGISTEQYCYAFFSALIKSTCHHSRCGWALESPFMHEVIAELGMWQLVHMTGLPISEENDTPETRSNWIKQLRADRFFLIRATEIAQEAIDYILLAKERKNSKGKDK